MDLEQLPKTLNRTIFPAEIEALLVKERQARQDTNVPLSTQIITQTVKLAHDTLAVPMQCELLKLLSTKRGQPVKSQCEMVKLCMGYIDTIQNLVEKT